MTATIALPQLEIVETNSPFDEAVIMIDGHEEETITIACTGARELAIAIVAAMRIADMAIGALPPADDAQTPYRSEA